MRYLFNRYTELRSVRALVSEANAGLVEVRSPEPDGSGEGLTLVPGGATPRRFNRGQLYHLLSNPIYVGKVRHREKVYAGEHDAAELTAQMLLRLPELPHSWSEQEALLGY